VRHRLHNDLLLTYLDCAQGTMESADIEYGALVSRVDSNIMVSKMELK